ncbi:MAG: hypothetical protein NTU54_02155 [Candidatus Omnitrophica bacterium]|nr:hypothetical protein [Candidatus Omnitrophota bacterium]
MACWCFLFYPSVIINSSYWGQWDTVHIALIMASLYYLLLDNSTNDWKIVILFAASLTCKPVAPLILLPLYATWALQNKGRIWKLLIYTPLIYILSIIPCWLAGKPFTDLLFYDWKIVSIQRHYSLTFNAPNIYQWIPNNPGILLSGGLSVLLIMLLMTLAFSYIKYEEGRKAQAYIDIAMFSSLLIPFISPMMHERYFFLADILSIVFVFYHPRFFFIPIILALSSFLSYYPYLSNLGPPIPLKYVSVLILLMIILLIKQLSCSYLRPNLINNTNGHG